MIEKLKNGMKKFVKTVKDNSIFLLSAFLTFGVAFWFNEKLEPYHNTLMLAITLIYVVATVIICDANGESAKAAQEQLYESKRQFEETKRLNIMPCLDVVLDSHGSGEETKAVNLTPNSSTNSVSCSKTILIENVGLGVAKSIRGSFISNGKTKWSFVLPLFPIQRQKRYRLMFYANSEYIIKGKPLNVFLEVHCEDLMGHKYAQKASISCTIKRDELQIAVANLSAPNLIAEETTDV